MAKQTLSQALQKAKGKEGLLDGFGTSKDNFLTGDMLSEIEIVIGEFTKRVQQNLQSEDMIVTGTIDDIQTKVDGSDIVVLAAPHLIYQDKGVNGTKLAPYNTPFKYTNKKPPVEPIIEWVKFRGLGTTEEETESIAYAIREKIYQEGMKPRNVYSKELPKLIDDIRGKIGELVVQVIAKNFGK